MVSQSNSRSCSSNSELPIPMTFTPTLVPLVALVASSLPVLAVDDLPLCSPTSTTSNMSHGLGMTDKVTVYGYHLARITYVAAPTDSIPTLTVKGVGVGVEEAEPLVMTTEDGSIVIERSSCNEDTSTTGEPTLPTFAPTASEPEEGKPTAAPSANETTTSSSGRNKACLNTTFVLVLLSLVSSLMSTKQGRGGLLWTGLVAGVLIVLLGGGPTTVHAHNTTADECLPILELEIALPIGDCPYNNIVDGECLTPAQVTNRAYQAIFVDHDPDAIRKYVATDYIQHNPNVPDGVEPIVGLAANVQAAGVLFDTYRIFEDGDMAVTHNVVGNAAMAFGLDKFIVFDIFRTANGQVVEHWDNIQPFPDELNPAGRSVVDGPVMIKYLRDTETSRQAVTEMVYTVFANGNVSAAPLYISNVTYHQHNPMIGDGLDTFMSVFQSVFDSGGTVVYDVKLVFAQGNYVFIGAEGYIGAPKIETDAFFDLFRVQDGLIVEHWDVIEHIPPLDEFANGNGKW